jgi:lipopolysaccharide transport system ATP-binding protein
MSSDADRLPEDVVIRVEDLGKVYRTFTTPIDRLKQWVVGDRRRLYQESWALRDVSFDIRRGETVGLVGRNGAGKSTLLQVLAGTLRPSTGQALVRGRVSALLELGAGFNGDFSGRDNLYMNAAILGLSRDEIEERMAAVIDFADIGDYIDMPVRTYSSGMYVRLAFSLAISVQPDILIVDEALSVGDEGFQNKCFARIRDFQEGGGTLFFVSHSPQAVIQFCRRALLIDSGSLLLDGEPKSVIDQFHRLVFAPAESREAIINDIRSGGSTEVTDVAPAGEEVGSAAETAIGESFDPNLTAKGRTALPENGARILNPRIETLDGKPVNTLIRGNRYRFCFDVEFLGDAWQVLFQMMIRTHAGYPLGGSRSARPSELTLKARAGERASVSFTFPCRLFSASHYTISCGVMGRGGADFGFLHRIIDSVMFRVQADPDLMLQGLVDFELEPAVTMNPEPAPS